MGVSEGIFKMKIKNMIAELQKFDPNGEILVSSSGYDDVDTEVFLGTAFAYESFGQWRIFREKQTALDERQAVLENCGEPIGSVVPICTIRV